MSDQVQIAEVLPTKIWVESGMFGERAVMVQHEGMEPFEYAVFNYRYGYTDNLSTYCSAENLARSLGAAEPVEHRQRSLPPTPAADQQTERAAFEAWARTKFGRGMVIQSRSGPYVWDDVNDAWAVWRARAACFAGGSPAKDVEAPAAINQDSLRLDWLEIMANKKGGLLLHDGSERKRVGLGLRPGNLVRTLREAIDTSRGLKLTKSSAAAPIGSDK